MRARAACRAACLLVNPPLSSRMLASESCIYSTLPSHPATRPDFYRTRHSFRPADAEFGVLRRLPFAPLRAHPLLSVEGGGGGVVSQTEAGVLQRGRSRMCTLWGASVVDFFAHESLPYIRPAYTCRTVATLRARPGDRPYREAGAAARAERYVATVLSSSSTTTTTTTTTGCSTAAELAVTNLPNYAGEGGTSVALTYRPRSNGKWPQRGGVAAEAT